MSRKSNNSDSATSALALILLVIFALPFVGVFLMSKKDSDVKALGLILTIVGIIIWIVLAIINA